MSEWIDNLDLRLPVLTLAAAVVNGAVGYGFSSITVPVALLFVSNRVLNPALVIVEVVVNAWSLWVNRRQLNAAYPVVRPILMGLPPGIVAGTAVLASVDQEWMKGVTYAALVPMILLQSLGVRWRLRRMHLAGPAIGGAVGTLYSITTISGPPLAVVLTNEGLTKGEFRAGMALVRLTESTLTAVAYAWAGLFTVSSLHVVPTILPGVMVGIPLGAALIGRMSPDVFRRICISLDLWLVCYGLAGVLHRLGIASLMFSSAWAAVVITFDAWSMARFFRSRRGQAAI